MSYTYIEGILRAGVLGNSVAVAKLSPAGSGTLRETGNCLPPTAYWHTAASSTAKRQSQFDETNPTRNSHVL